MSDDARLGLAVTHRRYVPYSHAHYGGGLVEGAYVLAEELRCAIARLRVLPDADEPVTMSLGVATAELGTPGADGLIAAADQALYAAKRAGKNRTVRAERGPRGVPAAPAAGRDAPAGSFRGLPAPAADPAAARDPARRRLALTH